jgi:hypothetical protein
MNGILEKKEEGWFVRWSDLHSFTHGTHWMWTPLHPTEVVDETKLKDGDEVEFEITPEFTYGKEVGKTIKIKATINSIETEQETVEESVVIEKIAMDKLKDKWNHLYTFGYPQRPFPTNYENDLNNIKIGLYEGAKGQQEQEKNKYNDEDLRTAYFSGIKTTGEGWNGEYANGNNPSIEEEFQEGFQEWLRQFKNNLKTNNI